MVNGQQRKRRAAVLLILAASIWWAEWMPAVLVTAFLLWVILHKRLEDDPGETLLRRWRRVWPPATVVLIPLLLAGTFVFWVSKRPIEAKVLPVALNLFALSMILFGSWWRLCAHVEAFRGRQAGVVKPDAHFASSARRQVDVGADRDGPAALTSVLGVD